MWLTLLVGLALGFFGSIPVAGPTSILVLKNTLERGNRQGLDIAVGAAVGEAVYALVAFWGLTEALLRFPALVIVARVLGALLVIGIGVYLVVRKKKAEPEEARSVRDSLQGKRWARGFAIAIFNPTFIVTWTTVVTALHGASLLRMKPTDAIPFSLGVGAGIMAWFFFLVKVVQRFRDRMRPEHLDRAVRGMGWAMIAIGGVIASRALLKLQWS
ncbi:MAG TPA: LysE family transporter [Polyangiaceae bacterium]|nr:LysE family transporter [Polyangiaceae bacterium]